MEQVHHNEPSMIGIKVLQMPKPEEQIRLPVDPEVAREIVAELGTSSCVNHLCGCT
jgi:hypothetical protein